LEKKSLQPFCDRPRILLVRHLFSNSEVLVLSCHVIVVNVEHRLHFNCEQYEFVKV
jgi:hypothetical protein